MAKLNFTERPRGVVIASMFKVDKVKGYSIKFNGKIKNAETGKWEDAPEGSKLMEISYGESMLCVPNNRKTSDNHPDFIVYAYPDQKVEAKKEETPEEEAPAETKEA